ncbi:DUF1631 family protein [Arenimonas sp. GDDSR-1]|uniref:DUF1631 family protein n=1 Tax=Arenimonas sp. GDDSR-1 TaxID=2950125 RepID=UPI002611B07D|nr:DUF1631 family protein [Arenimonas sp. GDDSR-1]
MIDETGISMPTIASPDAEMVYGRVHAAAKSRLVRIIANAVSNTDSFLYDICQQDQSTIGSPNIENLRLFRTASQIIEHQFSRSVDAAFAGFHGKPKVGGHSADLALVDIEDIDDVVNSELVSEAVVRSASDGITITCLRLCAIFGFPAAKKIDAPLSEKQLAEFLKQAMSGVELPTKIRFMLFRNFETALLSALPELLDECNEPMVQYGVLPHLQSLRSTRAGSDRSAPAVERVVHTERAAVPPQNAATAQHYRHFEDAPDIGEGATEQALFRELCSHLHSWRPQHGYYQDPAMAGSPANGSSRRKLQKNETIALLSSMQRILPEAVALALNNNELSLSAMLKSAMLGNTRKIGLAPDVVEINQDDEDAVDLVGMLFDVLMTERDFQEEAKSLMSRLIVPYAKAAVLDRRLFLTKAHPARKLLNALAEAVEGNQGDGAQERDLLNRAEVTVDRLVAGFNEDIAIFETLEVEMRSYLDQHRRRIELAEKRAKEAQRGQERLENARMLAARELQHRSVNSGLPGTISEFFSRYWTHHLSMIALREGEESQSWALALQLADDILAMLATQPPSARLEPMHRHRTAIEAVLSSSGVMADTSSAFIQKMTDEVCQYQPSAAIPVAEPAPVVEAPAPKPAFGLHLAYDKNAIEFDESDVEYFRSLPIGGWLQLEGSNGSFSPIKLAWISPISSRLMFVNRRGVRVLVVSVEELAQMKKQGKLIIHAEENVFEQTLDRVLHRLKADFS